MGRGEAGPWRFSSFFSLIRLSVRLFGEKAANSEEDGSRKQPGEARAPRSKPSPESCMPQPDFEGLGGGKEVKFLLLGGWV